MTTRPNVLSARDQFAIAALQAMLSNPENTKDGDELTMKDWCYDAYRYADYMLVEQEHDQPSRRSEYRDERMAKYGYEE